MVEDAPWFGGFPQSALRLVASAPPLDQPPLGVGDRCRLNSGGPLMTVIEESEDWVLAAWHLLDWSVTEHRFSRATVRRADE